MKVPLTQKMCRIFLKGKHHIDVAKVYQSDFFKRLDEVEKK
jgi:hypothetical protein